MRRAITSWYCINGNDNSDNDMSNDIIKIIFKW